MRRPQALTGSDEGLLAAQRSPATPLQRLAGHAQAVAGKLAALKQQRSEAAGSAYLSYVLDKQIAFLSDPSNTAFEELELPELIKVTRDAGAAAAAAAACVCCALLLACACVCVLHGARVCCCMCPPECNPLPRVPAAVCVASRTDPCSGAVWTHACQLLCWPLVRSRVAAARVRALPAGAL